MMEPRESSGVVRVFLFIASVVVISGAGSGPLQHEPYSETIAGTLVSFDMMPVAGGPVSVTDAEAPDGNRLLEVAPFWIGKTEVTWDELDVWMLGLDTEPERRAGIDAESRPSRPYGAPDRGFGHAGFAAISVTFHAAQSYAEWLSAKTGRSYRLPTRAEWQLACLANLGIDPGTTSAVDAPGTVGAEALEAQAWHAGNAGDTTHPVGTKAPGALGVFDMLGNAGEWASEGDGGPALLGGTYRDAPADVHCFSRAPQQRSWNERDPQIPKSTWWLSDGPFAGFRLVRDGHD